HKPLLQAMFRERYKTNTTAYWLERLEAQDLLCAPVKSLRQALADPQTLHNAMIVEGDEGVCGATKMRLVGSPIRMSGAAAGVRVTIDRPASMNAVDGATEEELEAIWQSIERDPKVRVVVLTGAGERAFSAGADMKSSGNQTGLEYWAAAHHGGFGGIALRET